MYAMSENPLLFLHAPCKYKRSVIAHCTTYNLNNHMQPENPKKRARLIIHKDVTLNECKIHCYTCVEISRQKLNKNISTKSFSSSDVKCVCLKRFWLCTPLLNLVLQIGKYLQFTPSAKMPQGLFNRPLL